MLRLKIYGLLFVTTVFLVMVLSGCVKTDPVQQQKPSSGMETVQNQMDDSIPKEVPYKEEYKADPASFVVFHQSVEPRETYVPIADIQKYKTEYPDCNGTWFRDQLSQEDLCIYNGYLYAMENCFIGFELYVEDNDKSFYNVRQAVSLDSPFLEQNMNLIGEHMIDWPTNYIGESIYIGMDQFTRSRWDKKMEALEKCRQIVKAIPSDCVTEQEKMEYLYRYVCQNVEYVSYENPEDNDYLYDAVITGKTNCDGYSNMLNLLFNLAGIESYEAMGSDVEDYSVLTPEELSVTTGHTWVTAKMNGQFFNFDPTFEDTKPEHWQYDFVFFGYSDDLRPVQFLDGEDQRPKCTDTTRDYHYADIVISAINSAEVQRISQLCRLRAQEGEYVTMVAVSETLNEDKIAQFATMFFHFYGISDGIRGIQTSVYEINHENNIIWVTVEM